jgi:gliding motility-associated-like protein
MNMIVLGTCNNSPPNTNINDDIVGGKYAGNNIIYTCNDSKEISFSISAIDSNKDHVNVVASNLPPGAVLHIDHNNTDTPALSFRWTLSGSVPNGTYSFYVEYTDDACPISSKQTVAYTIIIVSPFTFDYNVGFPTRCYNKAYLNMIVANGANPKDITITLNDNYKVKQFRDSTKGNTYFADSFVVGNYRIDISSPVLPCSSSYTFTVVDSGRYPFPPEYDNIHLCTNDTPIDIPATSKIYKTPIHWYNIDGTKLQSAPVYNTKTPKTYYYFVTQQVGACESVTDTFKIVVHKTPDIEIINSKPVICLGDNLLLQAKGADTYEWLPTDKVTKADDGNFYTKIMQPSTYQVLGRTLYGCIDTASVTYDRIEQCCSYYYPSAFTPNNDGLNDGFRISVFGNTSQYQLSVYNRWGELVFMSNDPKKYWDGTYKGKTCDVGTYYYRVTGVCLTGPQEEQAGEFLLIR